MEDSVMNRMLLKKTGATKYISHLDLMRTMQRVFVRAGLSIKHTQGFNPHPYISFALPLSVGIESECELVDFELNEDISFQELPKLLTSASPEGIIVTDVYRAERKFKEIAWLQVEGKFIYDNGRADEAAERLERLFSSEELVISKKTKRGTTDIDIIHCIDSLKITAVSDSELKIDAVLSAQNPGLSPLQLISAIKQKAPEAEPDYSAFRRVEVFDKDKNIFR